MAVVAVVAPGKLVLAGEYAVLDGGPALVMAVDRGVRCEVHPGGDGVRIETPDGDDRFVLPALAGAPAGLYRFTDTHPPPAAGKAGFGGSAAACVAACVAAGRPALDALELHRQVQGGGSGVDVLASVHGGCLRIQDGAVRPVAVRPPLVVYSGAPARTGPRVQRYQAWADAAARARFVAASAAVVDRFAIDPIAAATEALALLRAMSAQVGLEYDSPGLDRIAALARAHGGAAKPSGAGGGDVAVAWLPDPDAAQAFLAACEAAGLPPIPVSPAPGVTRV